MVVSTRKIPPGAEGWAVAEIKVGDNGMGVAGPILSKIFQPFFTTKGPGQGTGLGLYIAKYIAEHHHGKIAVYNNNPKGSIFEVTF